MDANDGANWGWQGYCYLMTKEHQKAFTAYQQALSLVPEPTDPQTWYGLGMLYEHYGSLDEAEKYLNNSLRFGRSRCSTSSAASAPTEAHEAYQRAVYTNERDPTYWCSIGVLYYYNNQYHDALGTSSRELQLNPALSEIWYNLGILYECCAQTRDAMDGERSRS